MTNPDLFSLIEGMLEGVWILDPVTLHILAVNRAAAPVGTGTHRIGNSRRYPARNHRANRRWCRLSR